MRVWLHSQLCVLLSDKEKRQTNKSPATSTVTAGAGWCGEPITGTAGNSCHHTTNTLYLNLLLELLSCSGGSSVVRGPSEGHMRTEGGRSSPVPGYLGNTDSADRFTMIPNKTTSRHDVITPYCTSQTKTKMLQCDFLKVNVCISWIDLSRECMLWVVCWECVNGAEKHNPARFGGQELGPGLQTQAIPVQTDRELQTAHWVNSICFWIGQFLRHLNDVRAAPSPPQRRQTARKTTEHSFDGKWRSSLYPSLKQTSPHLTVPCHPLA